MQEIVTKLSEEPLVGDAAEEEFRETLSDGALCPFCVPPLSSSKSRVPYLTGMQ